MLTRFTGYEGEAEVLGKLRAVRFSSDGVLRVSGLTMEEANDALKRLAVGSFAATTIEQGQIVIALREARKVGADEAVAGPVPAVVAPAPVVETPAGSVLPEEYAAAEQEFLGAEAADCAGADGAAEAVAAAEKKIEDLRSRDERAKGSAEKVAAEETPEPETPSCAPDSPPASPVPAPQTDEDTLLLSLRSQTTIRGVLSVLEQSGVEGLDVLVERCEALKGKVPLLGRVTNFRDRVSRTYGLMHQSGK